MLSRCINLLINKDSFRGEVLFNSTKYARWYFQIIDNAEKRVKPEGYCEKHHKVPKSIGGSHKKDNLVPLTAREHLLCHLLLSKMMLDPEHTLKMKRALAAMLAKNTRVQRERTTSHMYAAMRKAASESSALRDPLKRFNTAECSDEYRVKMSEALKGREAPWRKGVKDSEETRLKKSLSGKTKVFTPEHRANLSAANKRRKLKQN